MFKKKAYLPNLITKILKNKKNIMKTKNNELWTKLEKSLLVFFAAKSKLFNFQNFV